MKMRIPKFTTCLLNFLVNFLVNLLVCFGVYLLPIHLSYACLGEQESSIESDRQALKGEIKVIDKKSYRIHEITYNENQKIWEYSVPDGTVFAISWLGTTPPDLQILLGKYWNEYKEKESASHSPSPFAGGRQHIPLKTQNLIVEKSGHMRDIKGKAYLHLSLPQGFSAEDIHYVEGSH